MDGSRYNSEAVRAKAPLFFAAAKRARSLEDMRKRMAELIAQLEFDTFNEYDRIEEGSIIRVRDCARALRGMLRKRSDDLAGFSLAKALRDVTNNKPRSDLSPAFWAEMFHLLTGAQGLGPGAPPDYPYLETTDLHGREAAVKRSRDLDVLWTKKVSVDIDRFGSGLEPEVVERRKRRRGKILAALGGTESDWFDYRWQLGHVAREIGDVEKLVELSADERESIEQARRNKLPFGVTPYYLSLMDDEPTGRDRAIRAQVFPPGSYVKRMSEGRVRDQESFDFMLEHDTSPIDLITRRYPAIAIFKPFNTCPQICVYCQRNWEIDAPMEPMALATEESREEAMSWVAEHPALHELLVTGGDPLGLGDDEFKKVFDRLAEIYTICFIRIGTRTPATAPMRITDQVADYLGSLRVPGKRQVAVVTHVQHSYEVTPEMMEAVDKLRLRGIPVYNQLVYTFFVSRRFEAAALRHHLRLIGIDPYYTFATKGKDETLAYRVPMARLLQEQKEEARMMPGLTRTDEAVYNVPGLGKNYLRAGQHRDLISILPDGSRVYEFHPWEKNISKRLNTYVGADVPILDYLERLEAIGENVEEYSTIWYYY